MDTYILLIFLAYTVPTGVDGVGGGAAITSEKHVFWNEKDCLRALSLISGAFERQGFKRHTAVCVRSTGPGSGSAEPAVVGK